MQYNFIGKKRVDYVSKKTGKQVLGWNLFVTREDQQTEGLLAEQLYVPDAFRINVPVGSTVEVYFNRFGGVDSFTAV